MQNIDDLFRHFAERTIWELDNVCMKRKCVICEYWYKLGLDLYNA